MELRERVVHSKILWYSPIKLKKSAQINDDRLKLPIYVYFSILHLDDYELTTLLINLVLSKWSFLL